MEREEREGGGEGIGKKMGKEEQCARHKESWRREWDKERGVEGGGGWRSMIYEGEEANRADEYT